MAKPTAVGSAACCRTVVLTALAAKTHAHRLLHTAGRTPRVATTTTVVTVGTPTVTSLTMVPHNNFNTATHKEPKVVAQLPTRFRFFSPSMACPQHLPPVPTHQVYSTGPLRTRTPTDANGDFPHQLTTQRRYTGTSYPAGSTHGKYVRPRRRPWRPRRRRCLFTVRTGYADRSRTSRRRSES